MCIVVDGKEAPCWFGMSGSSDCPLCGRNVRSMYACIPCAKPSRCLDLPDGDFICAPWHSDACAMPVKLQQSHLPTPFHFWWGPCHAIAHLVEELYGNIFKMCETVCPAEGEAVKILLKQYLRTRRVTGLRWADVKHLPSLSGDAPAGGSSHRRSPQTGNWPTATGLPDWCRTMIRLAQQLTLYWRSGSASSEQFRSVSQQLLSLWKAHFPADDPKGYQFNVSSLFVLQHLHQYVSFWGPRCASVLGSEEAGEKGHQETKSQWASSMQLCGRAEGSSSAAQTVLTRSLRRLMFRIVDSDVGSSSDSDSAESLSGSSDRSE